MAGIYVAAAAGFYAWMIKRAVPHEETEGTHTPRLVVESGGLSQHPSREDEQRRVA